MTTEAKSQELFMAGEGTLRSHVGNGVSLGQWSSCQWS